MKVLVVSTNRERTPYPVVPVGPCLVAAQLERDGIEARVVDLMWEEDSSLPLKRVIDDFRPDFVGVSMRNVDNSDLIGTKYFVPEICELFSRLRRITAAPLILGEPFFYFSPELPREWYLEELSRFGREHRNVVNSFEAQQPVVERLTRWCMYLPLPRPRWRVLPRLRRIVDPFRGIRPRVFEDHPYPIVPEPGAC